MRIFTTALLSVYTLAAQTGTTSGAPPAFEVASIKPSQPQPDGQMRIGGSIDPGRVALANMSLRELMARAYEVKLAQISGPAWIDTERYDVNAKIPNGMADQVNAMMRTLVEERFQLRLHRENKEMAVYELVQGKNPLKLEKAAEPTARPRMSMEGHGDGVMHASINSATMANFSDMIGRWVDRPVIDKTGISGQYDLKLDLAMEDLQRSRSSVVMHAMPAGAGPANPAPDGGPTGSLLTSIQKLGLKLEAKRAPMDLLVIDKAEKVPLEN